MAFSRPDGVAGALQVEQLAIERAKTNASVEYAMAESAFRQERGAVRILANGCQAAAQCSCYVWADSAWRELPEQVLHMV